MQSSGIIYFIIFHYLFSFCFSFNLGGMKILFRSIVKYPNNGIKTLFYSILLYFILSHFILLYLI